MRGELNVVINYEDKAYIDRKVTRVDLSIN